MTLNSQNIVRLVEERQEDPVGIDITAKISKSQLREPIYLEMATRGVVEIRTGGPEDVAMLPLSQLLETQKVQHQFQLFLKSTVALKNPDVPRALLGDVAFVVDLSIDDRERFLDDFAEALVVSIQRGDHRPASFVFEGYKNAATHSLTGSPTFSGEFGVEVEEALRDHIART